MRLRSLLAAALLATTTLAGLSVTSAFAQANGQAISNDSEHMTYGRDADNAIQQIKSYNDGFKTNGDAATFKPYSNAIAYSEISADNQAANMAAGVNLFEGDDPYFIDKPSRFDDSDIKLIADAGFHTIRVPLFAFKHIVDTQGNLSPQYLERIDHLIDLAVANHLNIILDEHNYEECAKDADGCAVLLPNVWYDLANRYRNAPSNVIFELLNEPNGQVDAQIWNAWLPDLIAMIRETNPTRNLIIGPVMWNSPDQLSTLQLPANDRHIIVTFHYYSPMEFTHQGASWAGPQLEAMRGVRWTGTADQLAAINTTFDNVATWSKANSRPIFLGEFGSYAKVNTNLDDRVAWTRAVSKAAADRGFARALWVYEGTGGFGIHDAGKGWLDPLKNAVVNP